MKNRRTLVGALGMVALLTGCADSGERGSADAVSVSESTRQMLRGDGRPPPPTVENFFHFYSADYLSFGSPENFTSASFVEIVMRARIARFAAGPVLWADEPESAVPRIIMFLEPVEVAKGSPQGLVKVVLPKGPYSLGDFAKVFPHGMETVVYLSRLTGDLRRGMGLTAATDPGYYMPSTPEGFVVDDPEDPAIDYPMGGPEVVKATRLEAVMPDR